MCNRCFSSSDEDQKPELLAVVHTDDANALAENNGGDITANNDIEPNDNTGSAVEIDLPASFDGSINTPTDSDLFEIVADIDGELTITLTGLTADIDLYLYDASGLVIERSVNGGDRSESITFDVEAGQTYYIGVSGFDGAQSTYTLAASLEEATPPPPNLDTEPNNSLQTATAVDFPNSFSGAIDSGSDEDFYSFTVTETGELTVQMSELSADLDIILYDSNGVEVARSEGPDDSTETIFFSVEAGQSYSIGIYGFAGAESTYEISTSVAVVDFAGATAIEQFSNTTGSVTTEDSDDIYSFTATTTGTMSLALFGFSISDDIAVDMELQIYDADLNLISSSDNAFSSGELLTLDAIAGTEYFVRVVAAVDPVSDYVLRLVEGERTTGALVDSTLVASDVDLSDDTDAFFLARRWFPNQTLGYDLSELNDPMMIAALTNVFSSLTNTISLDFTPDPLGVFQLIEDDNLDGGVLGVAYIIRSPFNEQFVLSDASTSTGIHELGHALGLLHPDDPDNDDYDSSIHGLPYTVMNAFDGTVADDENDGYATLEVTGFLVLDLEYLIDIYGEDSVNLADSEHIFDTSKDYFEGLHDGGGDDTLRIIDEASVGVNITVAPRGEMDLGTSVGGTRDATVILTDTTEIETIITGAGDDTITGYEIDNKIESGAGDDIVDGAGGDDSLYGGAGDDQLTGGDGADVFEGGTGADTLFANLTGDTLSGGDGGDIFNITISLDTQISSPTRVLDFNGSSDTLSLLSDLGAAAADEINLQDGTDSEAGNALVVDTTTGSVLIVVEGIAASDLASAISYGDGDSSGSGSGGPVTLPPGSDGTGDDDDLDGTDEADDIEAFDGDDTIEAGDGDDTVDGGLGNDSILGGRGNDQLDGGEGDDTLKGGRGDDDISGGNGFDEVVGSFGNDTLSGGRGGDRLTGQDGDDYLVGDQARDLLIGGEGADTLDGGVSLRDRAVYTTSDASVTIILPEDGERTIGSGGEAEGDVLIGIEQVSGSAFGDHITGNSDDNRLIGGGGDDTLIGASGDDLLIGGSGDDVLVGGEGADTLKGGAGSDTFQYTGAGDITISDFAVDSDTLDLSNLGLGPDFDLSSNSSEIDGGVLIDLGDTGSIFLLGRSLDDIGTLSVVL